MMMKKPSMMLLLALMMSSFMACKKSTPPLPDNTLSFESANIGLEPAANSIKIALQFARALSQETEINIQVQSTDLMYDKEYSIEPALINGILKLKAAAGSQKVEFVVKKHAQAAFNGNESITFKMIDNNGSLVAGSHSSTQLKFGSILSEGGKITLQGIAANESGDAAANQVYVDFSNNQQYPILRDLYDLGFFSGADFKVIINASNAATVIKTNKNQLEQVTAADFNINDLKVGHGLGSFNIIDAPNKNHWIEATAIEAIAANDSDNKVYILNRKGGSGNVLPVDELYKIRILRKGNTGYTLQYALVNEKQYKHLDIAKNNLNNFEYVSLKQNKVVDIEPAKLKWDLVWGYNMYYTAGTMPYAFADMIFINTLSGTQVSEVLNSTISFDNFSAANLGNITLNTAYDGIGSKWRSTQPATGVRTDRYYVLQDAAKNVYKIRFISMGVNDGGSRGKPVLEYKLIQKGS